MPSVPLSRTGESSCPRTAILRPSSDVHSRRIDFGLSYVDSSVAWRFPIAVSVRIAQNTATSDAEVSPFVSQFQIVFAIMLVYGVWFLPESPRWLMHEGRHVDAQRVVAALTDDAYDSEATILQTRIIMQSIEQSHQLGVVKKRNMFSNGPTQHFRRMLCGASSQIFQQIGGCNSVHPPIVGQLN